MIFIDLCCGEKTHENKEFSRKNSRPCCESRIMTCKVEPRFYTLESEVL